MSYRNPDDPDDVDGELQGLFTRATAQVGPRPDLAGRVERRLASGGGPGHSGGGVSRGPAIAGALGAFLVVALLVGALYALSNRGSTTLGGGSSTHRNSATPFSVSSVTLGVSPSSIAGKTCGTSETFIYTATFKIPASTAGGTIQFSYTLNNGRSQTPATVAVGPGATSATYTFTSSGALPADHTYPGPAEVMVTSPNSVTSNSALPSGSCVAPGAFTVTSVDMAVSPASLAGLSCGTNETVTYTATFHLPVSNPGGTIQFYWTDNNGRGSNPASVTVAPGQTAATYQFTWSGALPADHTAPEGGGVTVSSPNSITSPLVGPSGRCS